MDLRERPAALELRLRRLGEIGGAAHHRGDVAAKSVHDLVAGRSRGNLLLRRECGQRLGEAGVGPAAPDLIPFLAKLRKRLAPGLVAEPPVALEVPAVLPQAQDRKSTRLNSSHVK